MNKFKNLLLLSLITSNIALTEITVAQKTEPVISLNETTEISKTDDQIKQKLAEIEELLNLVALKQLEDEKVIPTEENIKNKNIIIKSKDLSVETAKKLGKLISYIYSNSGRLLSKNTLVSVGLIAWPYFKIHPEHLVALSALGSDFVIKLNSLITEGVLLGLANNPKQAAIGFSLFTAKETALALVKGLGTFAVKKIFRI